MKIVDGVFDVALLLELSAKNPQQRAVFVQTIEGVVARTPDEFERAREAIGSGERAAARAILHALRGSVGSLGARRFSAASARLEAALAAETTVAHALVEETGTELALTLERARAWLDVQSGDLALAVPAVPDNADMARFKSLLAQKNMQACDLYVSLRAQLKENLSADDLRALELAMGALDFDKALGLV